MRSGRLETRGREAIWLAVAVFALGSASGVAQVEIFEDAFEEGTCFEWDRVVPFCITPSES